MPTRRRAGSIVQKAGCWCAGVGAAVRSRNAVRNVMTTTGTTTAAVMINAVMINAATGTATARTTAGAGTTAETACPAGLASAGAAGCPHIAAWYDPPKPSEMGMPAKHVFSREQYLDILNESLRNHPGWRPGMAFVFHPAGADAHQATGVSCTGPASAMPVYEDIQRVAATLIVVRDA